MNNSIFRKQSLDRISSPEQLNDYIKVSNPSVWVILLAVVVLLVSVLIWLVFGALPDTLKVNALIQDGVTTCYVDDDIAVKLKAGMSVKLGDVSGTIAEISKNPISVAELTRKFNNEYTAASLTAGQWNYPVTVDIYGMPDGLYEMVITIDRVKPISFILN